MSAAEYGHAECVRLLIDAGADKDAKDDVWCFLFYFVCPHCTFREDDLKYLSHCYFGSLFAVDLLSTQSFYFFSFFGNAVWRGTVDGCEFYSQGGRTALIWASMSGRADCVQLLIDAGADKEATVNVRERVGRSLIF